jgi:hypothetical protein
MAHSNRIAEFPLQSKRMAMLVIHGIGEQNPYETLDSFARGLLTCLRQKFHFTVDISPLEIALKDWTQVGMHLQVKDGEGRGEEGSIDLFEFYWAPETEDKLSWKDTLRWLVRTDLTPLRYFADNLQQMMATSQMRFRSALWESLKLYAREIVRVLFLYIPLVVAVTWLLAWLSHPRSIWESAKPLLTPLNVYRQWPNPLPLVCYLAAVLMVWFMLQSATAYLRRNRQSIQGQAELLWFGLAFISAAVFFLFGVLLSDRLGVSLHPLWQTLLAKGVLKAVGAVLLAAAWRYILTGYVADVAVYVTSDAKSKNYVARSSILKGSSEALKRILASQMYDHVILAGHSLGSVIAYDTINELLVQCNGAAGPPNDQPSQKLTSEELQKLRGLLTFGSPLDKIYYFFREHLKENQAIRAQILSMLYSFRKRPSGRDYGPFKFSYSFTQLENLVWVNAWSLLDPVSGNLTFYHTDHQRSFWYWIPGLAHLSYWEDQNFYCYVVEKLLCSPQYARTLFRAEDAGEGGGKKAKADEQEFVSADS